LDLGAQNLYHLTLDSARAFVSKHGGISDEIKFTKTANQIARGSRPEVGSIHSRLSEIIDLSNVEYTSFDVCPGLRTEILDLNRQDLPERYREYFDVILNFGTTEHVFNQYNSYRVMHDALSSRGVFFHQVPTVGYVDHGYFCYHPLFFKDLALANDYEILDMWYSASGGYPINATIDFRDPLKPGLKNSATIQAEAMMPLCALLNVVMRKLRPSPFRIALELETAHSAPSSQVSALYLGTPVVRGTRTSHVALIRRLQPARRCSRCWACLPSLSAASFARGSMLAWLVPGRMALSSVGAPLSRQWKHGYGSCEPRATAFSRSVRSSVSAPAWCNGSLAQWAHSNYEHVSATGLLFRNFFGWSDEAQFCPVTANNRSEHSTG
jgi:hypothetical protein